MTFPEPTELSNWAKAAAPTDCFWSVRAVSETTRALTVRQDIVQSPADAYDTGLMVTICRAGAMAYAASSDISAQGVRQMFEQAQTLAADVNGHMVFAADPTMMPAPQGNYRSVCEKPVPDSLSAQIDMVSQVCQDLKIDDRIIDWAASLMLIDSSQIYLTSQDTCATQQFQFVVPNLRAVASDNGQTQTRTAAGQYNGFCQQGGYEVLEKSGFLTDARRIAEQALELTGAANCPSDQMDLILMPDQMMLQIHESIGHPLELDRILGDERNFAGTSFVTLDMFGQYQYGSELLNVSYDPTITNEFASFAFDDDGTPAQRQLLIENGLLRQPLGGKVSQTRAAQLEHQFEPVATTRACSWNRAPIDRMSNLNVEPGDASLADMVTQTELGVIMHTNSSWSIDDSRNKFQFGCEYGQMVRNGELAEVVRNPSYRGISANFWRSLAQVGNPDTFQVMGTPYCGKGEPMQIVRVGHASPVCRFTGIDVFGASQ